MPSPEFLDAVDQLFAATVDLSPDARREILAGFAGPPEVRREVESLLEALDSEGSPSSGNSPFSLGADPATHSTTLVGLRLGPWQVVREVGRGGMGAVYEAVRADDRYQKRVAIKTIGRAVDSVAMARRFRQEQRILASLEHAGIATLLDGGVTDEGVPYFVMEFVDGEPITRYCEQLGLSLPNRLDLFRQVCAAVEFAHRNLVVHRDLKPSNVLVTGDGIVKLLDFGIAKLLGEGNSGEVTLTEAGSRIFTTAYASPEQVRGEHITTASDVYSLGALLYLLLTGRLPIEVAQLTPTAALVKIAEATPPPPSAACTDAAAAVMGLRSREQLARALRGELDDIVLTALRKEPERRYPTVAALSEDLKRYLQGQQVSARPDTWRYRVRSFTRRNPRLVAALGVAALSLVAGAAIAGWQAVRAGDERDRAQSESARANRVVSFVEQLLATPTPGGLTGTAATILENALRQANTELADDPLARAAVSRTAARAYISSYQFDRAQTLLDTALVLDRRYAGPESNEVGRDLSMLGDVARGKGDYPLAVARGQEAVDLLRRHPGNKPEDLSQALSGLAWSLHYASRPADAAPYLEEAITRQRAQPLSLLLPYFISQRGFGLELLGRNEPAESAYRHALTLFDSLPEPAPFERGISEFELANVLARRGAFAEADVMGQNALRTFTRWLGPDQIWVGHAHGTLAMIASMRGQLDRALTEAEAAVRVMQGKSISVMERTRIDLQYAEVLARLDRWDEARTIWDRVLAERRRSQINEPMMIGEAIAAVGIERLHRRRYPEAEPLLLEAHAVYAKALGPEHAVVKQEASWLVFLYTAWDREDKAAPFLEALPPAYAADVKARARAFGRGGPWRAGGR